LAVTIGSAKPLNITELDVPGLDFRSLKFARKLTTTKGHQPNPMFSPFDYTGPHRKVLQTAYAVTVSGAILPIAPPAPNSTWVSKFPGPSLSCTRVQGEDFHTFLMNVAQYITSDSKSNCDYAASYLSWIRQRRGDGIDLPYKSATENASVLNAFNSGSATYSTPAYLGEGAMMASFYVALLPHMLDVYTISRIPGLQACHLVDDFLLSTETPLDSLGENVTLIQCDLVNSTYTTMFNFVDGSQDVDIQVDKSEEGIEVVRTVNWGHDPKLCLQDEDDPTESTDCKFDHSVLWRISYQSVMSAFSSMFTGQVTQNTNLDARNVNTSVTMTSLADTEDFAFLNEDYLGNDESETGWNLQDFMANWNASESQGVTYDNETELNGNSTQRNSLPLDEALEQLFQNFTVSLMSLPDLR
jgi:hypothetical protein